jgi:DHA1 family inner membrane transport protein
MTLALFSLFLAAFSIGTTEFVVAGLLPEISRDLAVSIPTAGLLVTGYALGVAIGGPIFSLITSRFPRKPTILVLMAVFLVGHALCALAPNYELLLVGRLVVSITHGTFFGLAGVAAVSIVPEERRGFALALVFAGISVANIVGVPLGTAVGNAWGWRATFVVVGAIALVATAAMIFALPKGLAAGSAGASLRSQFRGLLPHQVWLSYLVIIVMMIGFWSLFTFVAPFLTTVSGVEPAVVPWILLIFGVGATAGIMLGGRLSDWRQRELPALGFLAQLAVYVAIIAFAANGAAMTILAFAIGFAVFFVTAPLQDRILKGAGDAPDLASTLISAVYNTGIATGAFIGASMLSGGAAYTQLPWVGLWLAVVTVALALLSWWLDGRSPLPAKA